MHDQDEIAKRAKGILDRAVKRMKKADAGRPVNDMDVSGLEAQVANFIHTVLGRRSSYAESLRTAMKAKSCSDRLKGVFGILSALQDDLADGNLVNIRHQVEAVVVSEILGQAKTLAQTKAVHPAAVAIVACAAVEEFLRNWCQERGVKISKKQRSLNRFAQELRTAGVIKLPDARRIQSWADYRNEAAHGSWNYVSKKESDRILSEIENFVYEHKDVLG